MKQQMHFIEADLAGCETFHQDHGDWFYIESMRLEVKLESYLANWARFLEQHGE